MHRIHRTIQWLDGRLSTAIRLKEAAYEAGMSLYHYQHLFKEITGISPGEYLRLSRLQGAAKALIGTSRRIIDIALDYGYESSEAFHHAFKKEYGMGPREFRLSQTEWVLNPLLPQENALRQLSEIPGFRKAEHVIRRSFRIAGGGVIAPRQQKGPERLESSFVKNWLGSTGWKALLSTYSQAASVWLTGTNIPSQPALYRYSLGLSLAEDEVPEDLPLSSQQIPSALYLKIELYTDQPGQERAWNQLYNLGEVTPGCQIDYTRNNFCESPIDWDHKSQAKLHLYVPIEENKPSLS